MASRIVLCFTLMTNLLSVEQYPRGYPRLAALQSSDNDFIMFRRFATVHTRCLLLTQDYLCELKAELDEIDEKERTQLFLSSRKHDNNTERQLVLEKLKKTLREYGQTNQSLKQKPVD